MNWLLRYAIFHIPSLDTNIHDTFLVKTQRSHIQNNLTTTFLLSYCVCLERDIQSLFRKALDRLTNVLLVLKIIYIIVLTTFDFIKKY